MTHADASPSSASIWLNCPASVTRARGRVRRATQYTREGTAAHEVAERLVHGLDIPDEIEVEGETVPIDESMVEAVEVYVDYVDLLRKRSTHFFTETKVSVAGLPEPLFGTADTVGFNVHASPSIVEIVDLKFGKGVAVDAKDNAQLKIYGIGAVERLHAQGLVADRVKLTIVQPRISGKPAVDSVELAAGDLLMWGIEELFPAAQRVARGDETEIPGAHCRWCVRAGECRAFAAMTHELAVRAFDPDPAMEVRGLNNDELAAFLDKADLVSAWTILVRAEAAHRADQGGKIPGWKLVPKRALRKWVDENQAMNALAVREVPMTDVVKLVSPAAVERVLKSCKLDVKILDPYVVKQSSGTTLVRDSDKREELLALTPNSVFNPIPQADQLDDLL